MIDNRKRTLNDGFKIAFLETGAEQYRMETTEVLSKDSEEELNDFEKPLQPDLNNGAMTVKEQMMQNWV